jgi:hypothetical protein
VPGACDPADANSCDLRKRERCMPAPKQQQQYQVPPSVAANSDETYRKRQKKNSGEEQTYATREFMSWHLASLMCKLFVNMLFKYI